MILKSTFVFFMGLILSVSLMQGPMSQASTSENTSHMIMDASLMSGPMQHMDGDISSEEDCLAHCKNMASMDQSCSSGCSQISSPTMGLQSINKLHLIQVKNNGTPIVNEKIRISRPLIDVPPPKL